MYCSQLNLYLFAVCLDVHQLLYSFDNTLMYCIVLFCSALYFTRCQALFPLNFHIWKQIWTQTNCACLVTRNHNCADSSGLFNISICLLGQIKCPVWDIKERKDGREYYTGENVDLLGPGGKLVEPGHEEVLAFPWLHVDLALMDIVDREVCARD